MDRHLVGVHQRFQACLPLEVLLAQRGDPGRLFLRLELALNQVQHLPQNGLGIANDAHVHRPVATDLRRVDVDLNGLGVGIEAWCLTMRDHVVEAGGEEENDVGLAEGQRAGAEETARVVFGHHAAALRGGEERDAGLVDELLHFGGSVSPDDARATDDQRSLRPRQHVDGLSHQTGVTHAAVMRLGGSGHITSSSSTRL